MKNILIKGLFVSTSIIFITSSASAMTCTNLTKSLSKGSENSEVLKLQQFLVDGGYLTAKPNGYYGGGTVTAVKKFQKANGLSQVGSVGAGTRGKIKEVSCKSNTNSLQTPTKSNLCIDLHQDLSFFSSQHSTSSEILVLQQFLYDRNYLKSKPTGVFDSTTVFAVKDFKKKYSLAINDPMNSDVDSITRAKIKEISCSGIKESTTNSMGDFIKQCVTKMTPEIAASFVAESKFVATDGSGEEVSGLIELQKKAKISQTGKLDQSTKENICGLAVASAFKGFAKEVKNQNARATSSIIYNKKIVIDNVDLMNLPTITITGSGLDFATNYTIDSTLEDGHGVFSFGRMINSKGVLHPSNEKTPNKIVITLSKDDSNSIVKGLKKFTANKFFYLMDDKGHPGEPFMITNYKGAD